MSFRAVLRVLVVEHDRADAELCIAELRRTGFDVRADVASTVREFTDLLDAGEYDVVLSDYRLPGWTGMDALAVLRTRGTDLPLILVTGTLGEERAVECVKQGVADYVIKDNLARLPVAVHRALRDRRAQHDRVRADEMIHKLSLAVDQSPASVIITDTDGTIEYVNRRFTQVTGYTEAEALGQTPNLLRSGETPEDLLRQMWETIQSGGVWHGEIRNRKKTGEVYWDSVTISPVRDTNGVVTHYLAIQEDVTDRRRLEERLRQSHKMEAVGRLAGGVAHDFNNLLTVITSYAAMLHDDFTPTDPRRDDVEQIQKAAADAATLTRQLLAFSRKQVIEPRPVGLDEIVAASERMLQRVIGEDIELVTVRHDDSLIIMIDPGQLEQVIMNLVVNARDAMPSGGRLTIETSRVELDDTYTRSHWPATPGTFAMLAISDTGVGMDETTRAQVFEPFFTTKETGKGTGLGLATVYGIVKQSGGFIWVYSEPGRGSTFKIYLPLTDMPADHGLPEQAPRALHGTETVLLLEDAPSVRAATKHSLERFGYRVLEAPSGDAALALAASRHGPIHLLLTDVVMPGMSGREVAERFTALCPDVRVLYMSGYTDDAIVRHGVLQPGIAFLQKPFSPDVLARKVREVLDAASP